MTEREFRDRMSGSIFLEAARSPHHVAYVDSAVALAREAGLEFEPEPVKLPEQLLAGRCCPVGFRAILGTYIGADPFDRFRFTCPHGDAYELAQVIAARYNETYVLALMGLKLNQHGYRVGVVDDRDGVRAALLERYADGLTITEDRPRSQESSSVGSAALFKEES